MAHLLLVAHPNPFLPLPSQSGTHLVQVDPMGRLLSSRYTPSKSPTTEDQVWTHASPPTSVPSLLELCLRHTLSLPKPRLPKPFDTLLQMTRCTHCKAPMTRPVQSHVVWEEYGDGPRLPFLYRYCTLKCVPMSRR